MRTPPKGGAAESSKSAEHPTYTTALPPALAAQTIQRRAEHLNRLGARAMLEAMREVEAGADLDSVLRRHAELRLDVVKALGGNRFLDPIFLVSA